jgi:hypothetical protein
MEANYITKEHRWLQKRLGVISASELKRLLSKSGKFTQTNISYLYEKQYERLRKEMLPKVDTWEMRVGKENEQYAVAWLREHYPLLDIKHCSEDFDDIIFVVAESGLGISPDVIVGDNEGLIEIKCVTSRSTISTYFSPTMPYERKKAMAFEEHKEQLAGQLSGFPNLNEISLLKYRPQLDDNDWDMKSVVDKDRGILFTYTREELQDLIDEINRVVPIADAFISSNKDIGEINLQKKDEVLEKIAEVCKPKLK